MLLRLVAQVRVRAEQTAAFHAEQEGLAGLERILGPRLVDRNGAMGFFEPPPPPPEPASSQWRQPAWSGPPDDVVGSVVALDLVAAESPTAAVWLASATVYPSGIEFDVEVRWRPEVFDVVARGAPWHFRPGIDQELPDELFRAGIEFADGSKVTTLGTGLTGGAVATPAVGEPAGEPQGPVLVPRGGGGGGHSWSQRLWLWPLPPESPLSFVCEWPALGIPVTRTQLNHTPITEAASRSRRLWQR